MPTKNPRINITLEEKTAQLLTSMAKNENISVSNLAKDLLLEALELREDIVFSNIADTRDIENAKKIKHDDAWK